MLAKLTIQIPDMIFVAIWIILAILFLVVAKNSKNLEKELNRVARSLEGERVGASITEFGRVVSVDKALVTGVKELSKSLSRIAKGAWIAAILSSIAAALAIAQLIL
jgi:hypothetical protein